MGMALHAHIERHANGPRLYVAGLRIHHGLPGLALVGVGLAVKLPMVVAVGTVLVMHDRRDWPFRLVEKEAV